MSMVYIVNHGNIVFTPSKEKHEYTMTIPVGDSYCKVRYQKIRHLFPLPCAVETCDYIPSLSKKVGSGSVVLEVNRSRLLSAIDEIKEDALRSRVKEAVEVNLTESAHVEFVDVLSHPLLKKEPLKGLKGEEYTISCMMGYEHRLDIVAVRSFSISKVKKVQEIRSLGVCRKADSDPVFPVIVRAIGSRNCIKNEIIFSEYLREKSVPHIIEMKELPTDAFSEKSSFAMRKAEYGDFAQYSRDHYDMCTGRVLPEFRREHILCMYYIAETLFRMHELKIVYGDMKPENILVTRVKPLEVFLTDFGLSGKCNSRLLTLPGTCPSPELTKLYQQDLVRASFEADLLRKEDSDCRMDPETFKQKFDALLDSHGIVLTPAVDEWAFGVMLLKAMHSKDVLPNKTLFTVFYHDSSCEQIETARDLVLEHVLKKEDPIDQIIALLLHKDSFRRISMEKVRSRLSQYV